MAYTNAQKRTARLAHRMRAITIKGSRCESCGTENHRILEFHHVNGDGKDDVQGSKLAYLVATCRRALDDLQLLCSNCHKEVTYDGGPA